jgi:hypothetical protein
LARKNGGVCVSVQNRGLSVLRLVGAAQTAAPDSQTGELPSWLTTFPGAHDEHHVGTTEISSSYRVSRPPAEVTEHYRKQLQNAAVKFNVSFDGIGTVIRCSEGKEYCVIQIRELDDGTSVKVSYSPSAGSSIGVVAGGESLQQPPAPASPAPARPKSDALPATHEIQYVIDGSAGAAGLTYRNADGGTEQRDVALPSRLSFRTIAGAFVYISAQKKGREGTVRVEIIVDGTIMQQSTSSSPFGIASASGRVVDQKIIY